MLRMKNEAEEAALQKLSEERQRVQEQEGGVSEQPTESVAATASTSASAKPAKKPPVEVDPAVLSAEQEILEEMI